jgi:putative ABC transport system permease protein
VLGIEARDASESSQFLVIGLRPEQIASYGPCARKPELVDALANHQGMILSRRSAWKHGYEVGDTVLLSTPSEGVQAFPVVAISDEYGYFLEPRDERIYGVVAAEHMKDYWCKDLDAVSSVSVRLDPDEDPEVVLAAVSGAFPDLAAAGDLRFTRARAMLQEHLWDLRKDFYLFDLILALTAGLACLGVLNGQLLSALERAKELGVLRALGMSRGQLAGTVLLESAVVGATGGLLGLGLGSLLTPVLVDVLRVVSGLELPHVGIGLLLFAVPAGALLVTALAGLYPIWRMSRMDAVAAVRTG